MERNTRMKAICPVWASCPAPPGRNTICIVLTQHRQTDPPASSISRKEHKGCVAPQGSPANEGGICSDYLSLMWYCSLLKGKTFIWWPSYLSYSHKDTSLWHLRFCCRCSSCYTTIICLFKLNANLKDFEYLQTSLSPCWFDSVCSYETLVI